MSKYLKRTLRLLVTAIVLAMPLSVCAADGEMGFDPGAEILGHIGDAHSWHLFDYYSGGGNHSVAIPLPVILINDGHLDVFSSSHFGHEPHRTDYRGYRLTGGGSEREQIICVDAEGNPTGVKPIDISISKTPAAILIAVVLLIVIVFVAKAGYKKRPNQAPHGLQSLVELLIVFVRDSIAIPMIGEAKYRRYLPYLLTLFFFIFFCNILGMIPIFPAGANITGNLAVTGTLAVVTFFITNLSGNKHYWTDIFNTPGVPAWLKIFPLMPLVELIEVFTKPIVLMLRLFANMTAGHVMILSFMMLIFILSNILGTAVGSAATVLSIGLSVFISAIECLMAYIQAFVFTMLTALYIGTAVAEPHHAEAK